MKGTQMSDRLEGILSQMTLEEKVDQLVMLDSSVYDKDAAITGPQVKLGLPEDIAHRMGAVYNVFGAARIRELQEDYLAHSRLGIPLLFCADIIYGHKTVLPIPLGFSCSWDPELVRDCMDMVAGEAAASGVHAVFSPMLDLSRDPRWGRVMEGLGEDPCLAARFAKAEVEGLQGDLGPSNVASCIKHFAAYGAVEGGRDYNAVDMSERKLRQEYLRPYEAAVKAGARMVMPSFNTINGIPSTANEWLLRDVLEGEWGFDGVKVSDYAAIQELVYHGFAEDCRDAARRAIACGMSFDMKTGVYAHNLARLVRDGEVDEALVDEAVMRVLRLKERLGLFDDPYRQCDVLREEELLRSDESRALAYRLACESVVLLKNEGGALPLASEGKVALVGPMADERSIVGMWAMNAGIASIRTLHDELSELLGDRLACAKGCEIADDYGFLGDMAKYFALPEDEGDASLLSQALDVVRDADVAVVALGEHFFQSGEAASRTDLSLARCQLELLRAVRKLGKHVVALVYSGRPLLLREVAESCDALVQVYWPGTEGSAAVADVLCGKVNPSGRLTMSVPVCMGQIPVYYGQMSTGRPLEGSGHEGKFVSKYLDAPNAPLYPFGYGLSYTTFEVRDVRLSSDTMSAGQALRVEAVVANTGDRDGDAVVQVYVRDVAGSVARPVKELVDFARVTIAAGGEATVAFEIGEDQLAAYGAHMRRVVEPGVFKLYVGLSSADVVEREFRYV